MRIGMVAPLVEPVPPPLYGGTERVVSVLTEELVRRGHDVTLFATGDSETNAHLIACAPRGLRLDDQVHDYNAFTIIELGEVYQRAQEFDVIHNHTDYFGFPFARLTETPTVTTTHGRLDLPEVQRVYQLFPEQPLVSISDAQRAPLRGQNWQATVYNGIELDNYTFRSEQGDYLVFLGRISPEKRPDRAIEIARDTGMPLIIAAKVDPVDQAYYEQAIRPLIESSRLIEYIGEVDEREKDKLLGEAYAYLFPIDWPEPFGLTMVESMATGTPVIASAVGSVPEVVVDGVTGFVRQSLHDMVDAVERVGQLDRAACRAHVEACFSAEAMARGYEQVYQRLAAHA
ncbi:MAG TPA: glycosyltransferase family 4 protein [Nitrolancea sp.]|nr:glycosyltransferase family 4 protein [Nitrolancea sp.]